MSAVVDFCGNHMKLRRNCIAYVQHGDMDTGRGRGEGWALVLKQLYAGQQISTPETALAGVSRSQCFYISCLTDIPVLVRDGRVVAQEVGEALL